MVSQVAGRCRTAGLGGRGPGARGAPGTAVARLPRPRTRRCHSGSRPGDRRRGCAAIPGECGSRSGSRCDRGGPSCTSRRGHTPSARAMARPGTVAHRSSSPPWSRACRPEPGLRPDRGLPLLHPSHASGTAWDESERRIRPRPPVRRGALARVDTSSRQRMRVAGRRDPERSARGERATTQSGGGRSACGCSDPGRVSQRLGQRNRLAVGGRRLGRVVRRCRTARFH